MGENELDEKQFGSAAGEAGNGAAHRPSDMGKHGRYPGALSNEDAAPVLSESSIPTVVPTAAAGAGVDNTANTVDSVVNFTESAIEERRKQRQNKRRAGIIAAAVVAGLLAIYLGGAAWFSGHFLPNTVIGGYEVSGMGVDETTAMLDEASDSYKLSVKGEGLKFNVKSATAGLRIDSGKVAQKAIERNNAWAWPVHMFGANVQDLSDTMQVTFDDKQFANFVTKKVQKFNKTATDPTPANIAYKKKQGGFAIVPEKLGTKLDEEVVLEKVKDAASQMLPRVEINEDDLLRPDLLSDDKRLAKAVDTADGLLGTDIQLTLNGVEWKKVGPKQVAKWIKLGDDVVPRLENELMYAWLDKMVASVDTVGTQRTYTTPRGETVTISGGSYGWQVDYNQFLADLQKAVNEHTKGTLEVPCAQYAASLPDKNGVDFGSRYIDVNLSAQHAVFYDGDKVLWESDIISGSPDGEHNTPQGVFMVNLMESPSKLVGEMTPVEVTVGKGKNAETTIEYQPEYETVVQYWMPFVGNAVGFHDATWQPGFGGSMYMEGYGSHGCVNLPYDAAEALYGVVTPGTPVISHG